MRAASVFLAAATLDGVPENLALGVALIGAGFWDVAGLAGAIFLSNVPEGASGAKGMHAIGWPRGRILAIWLGTALFLVVAAVAGNLLFRHAPQEYLVLMRVFAGGAIIAALATEIFPKAYRRDHQMAGIATAMGLLAALVLIHSMTD